MRSPRQRLLDLIADATDAGWSFRGACLELELGEGRAYRWLERRAAGELDAVFIGTGSIVNSTDRGNRDARDGGLQLLSHVSLTDTVLLSDLRLVRNCRIA